MKSILTSSQGFKGMGSEVYKPWWNWLFALWHMGQAEMIL